MVVCRLVGCRFVVLQRLRLLGTTFASAARNPTVLRVGVAYALFIGAQTGVWIALLVYAYQDHGGARAASVMALVQLVPGALLSPYLGSFADRWRCGRVLAGAYLALAGSMALVAALMALGAPRFWIFALAPLTNLAICVPRPAQAALMPSIVNSPEELAASNAGQGWLESAATLVAPIGVALLLATGGPALAVAGLTVVAISATGLVVTIAGPAPFARGDDDGPTARAGSSLHAVVRDPLVLLLVVVLGSQYVLIGALDLIFVVLAFGVLGMGQGGPGYLTAAFGAGGLLAIAVTAGLVGRARLTPALLAGGLCAPIALLLLAAHQTEAAALILIMVVGVGRSVFDVTGRMLLQRAAPPELLASVFGLLEALLNTGLAIGVLLVPVLVWAGGATGALLGTAAIVLVVVLVAMPRLRAVDAAANVPLVEINLLRSIPLFAALPAPALESLGRSLQRMHAPAGSTIIRQGDPGDTYYAIARGELSVTRDGVQVITRFRNEGVGEIALIRDTPRTATVVAVTDAELYALDRAPFLLALTGHRGAHQSAEEVVQKRLDELGVSTNGGPDGPPGDAVVTRSSTGQNLAP